MAEIAILDVDGTLVDTNYHHALAWFRAFRRFDVTLPVWHLHRAIGMGGDQLVTHVAGPRFEDEHGDDARAAWAEEFEPMLPEIQPFGGVRELLSAIRERGIPIVLASSGKPEHVEAYLNLFDGRDLADAWTTSADVDQTKPEPDPFAVAAARLGAPDAKATVIGDSVWDFLAAERAGHVGFAVRTGGFSDAELREAGAQDVFESLPELQQALDRILA